MHFLLCSCVLSCLVFVSANIPEYILESGASGHCGQTVNANQSVYVKSHTGAGLLGGMASYTSSQNCEITYNAGTGNQLLFQFTFFDLQPPVSSVCVDYVRMTGVTAVATSTVSTSTTVTTTLSTTTVLVTTANATLENATLANTTAADNTTAANVTSANETSTISSTFSTSVTPNYTEPSGVNATFWNTTEVCNYTQVNQTANGTSTEVNETLCWNVTESYVVWIPESTDSTSTVTSPPAGLVEVCQSPGTYISSGSTGIIRFVSDASIQRAGFTLLLTSFHTGSCTASEFLCDTNRCISNVLLCDSVTHCLDGADESTQQANCTVSSPVVSTGGLNRYAIIGIVVVAAAVVLTVFTMAMFWKYFSTSEGRCQCRGDGEDDSPWDTPPKQQPAAPTKPTKTVTVVSEKKPDPPPKGPIKKKVRPIVSEDVDW